MGRKKMPKFVVGTFFHIGGIPTPLRDLRIVRTRKRRAPEMRSGAEERGKKDLLKQLTLAETSPNQARQTDQTAPHHS